MLTGSRFPQRPFPELSYANQSHPRLKRWVIRTIEEMSGRARYAALYERWRNEVVPTGERIFGCMLDLIGVEMACRGTWPPAAIPEGPLVMVANHPYGIGDGIAMLSLAEQLGRPFRVMIHRDLLKIREMEPYSLPITFEDSKEAVRANLAVRHEALRLIREGVTIVIFPAGGVATAPRGFGEAVDLPWKMFAARLVRDSAATVIPVHFSGQNGRLFHLVSQPMAMAEREAGLRRLVGEISLTLRTSLLIREFARLSGRRIEATVGAPLAPGELAACVDRKALLARLQAAVFDLAPPPQGSARFIPRRRAPRHPGFGPARP